MSSEEHISLCSEGIAMTSTNETSSCNISAYTEWYWSQLSADELYLSSDTMRMRLLDIDRADIEAWRIMDFENGSKRDDFIELYSGRRPKTLEISSGRAMELSTIWCKEELDSISVEIAGGHG